MPSPVAHALAGLTLAAGWKPQQRVLVTTVVIVAAAGLPDIDVFPLLLFGNNAMPELLHHRAVHSFGFVAVAALVLAPLIARGRSLKSAWVVLFLAGCSHLALDLLAHDPTQPSGIPLFWPFSKGLWQAPFDLFPGYQKSGFPGILSATNWRKYLAEVAWLLPPLLLVMWRNSRARGAAPAG